MLERIIESYPDETFLKADGFDSAIIGYDSETYRLIYSISMCIKILMDRDNMDYLTAIEYFEFNVQGAYVGEKTPIWCDDTI